MANKYIRVEYDKFKELTCSTMASWLLLFEDKKSHYSVSLKKAEDATSYTMGLNFSYLGDSWFSLEPELIININGVENIVLNGDHGRIAKVEKEQLCDAEVALEAGLTQIYDEHGAIEITRETLKKICDAKTIDIRVIGTKQHMDLNANRLIKYAQIFYNGAFDEDAYKEVLNERFDYILTTDEVEMQEKKASSDKESSGGGCIVTLLMISSALSSLAACLFFIIDSLKSLL